jgi:hypothetical protein
VVEVKDERIFLSAIDAWMRCEEGDEAVEVRFDDSGPAPRGVSDVPLLVRRVVALLV